MPVPPPREPAIVPHRSVRRRRTAPLVLLAMLAPLSGCMGLAPSAAPVATAQPATGAASFTEARVVSDVAGALSVSWTATAIAGVTVFAGTNREVTENRRRVGRGGPQGAIALHDLPAADRWFVELVPDQGASIILAEQSLHLAGAPNLRDIGGYRTRDGRWVRPGLLYRSDQLDRLSDPDLERLQRGGIALVADLRTASERQREPDRLPAGARHIILDVMQASSNAMGGDMQSAMQLIAAGKGAAFLVDANRDFVSAPSALASYAALVSHIAAEPGATLFHCTAGKDRTGWASAILLTLLGVPRETVVADYLASNAYLAEKNEAIYARSSQRAGGLDRAMLEPVMTVRKAYIDAAFAEVEARYGSFDNYRRVGLGIDDRMVAALQERFLTGTAPPATR